MPESKKILNLAISIGEEMLKSGGEIYRVQETVSRILEAYGIRDYNVVVVTNGIFATVCEQRKDAGSMVRNVPIGDVNLKRVSEMNQLSREICSGGCGIKEAYKKLEQYMHGPSSDAGNLALILACGVGSAGFGYLLGARPYDSLISFFLGMILQAFQIAAYKRNASKFMVNIFGSALVTAGSLLLYAIGMGILYDRTIIGGIIRLVPGVALTTAIRESFDGDYLSGSVRLFDALLTGMCIAIGVGAAIKSFQLLSGGELPLYEAARDYTAGLGMYEMIIQLFVAMASTVAFGMLFYVPRSEYPYCAANGVIGWGTYLFCINHGMGAVISCMWAALVLTLAARILSAIRKMPGTVFLVTGIFTLVPGAGIYYTSYYLIMGDLTHFVQKGSETFITAGAIVLGIIFGLALPQTWFNQIGKLTGKLKRL